MASDADGPLSNGRTDLLADTGLPSANADTAEQKEANATGDGLDSATSASKKDAGELRDQPGSRVDRADLPDGHCRMLFEKVQLKWNRTVASVGPSMRPTIAAAEGGQFVACTRADLNCRQRRPAFSSGLWDQR